jgi:hypothetical protein
MSIGWRSVLAILLLAIMVVLALVAMWHKDKIVVGLCIGAEILGLIILIMIVVSP